jgi:DNA-binding NarL/FixJ family response regulator
MMKLLIVDDQTMVRRGISALLTHDEPAAVVLQAGDSAEGLALATQHGDLDAVFLDLALPGGDGMSAIGEFGRVRPNVPVIVLTASDDPLRVRRAFELGALGYVPKSASAQTLVAALHLVLSDEAFVPVLVLRDGQGAGPIDSWAPGPRGSLTPRQVEVLDGLAHGLSNKDIGRRLGLAEKTVKAHVTAVFRGLGASNRSDAVSLARATGVI